MAIRTIITEGEDTLRKRAREVTDFGQRTQTIIDDMIDTLYDAGNGIGLAAPQVGLLKRIFIVDLQDETGLKVFVNPKIVEEEGTQLCTEGCLSVPGKWGQVERPESILVKAQDRFGESFELRAEALMANVICHENDHLNGVLFIDKVIGDLMTEGDSA